MPVHTAPDTFENGMKTMMRSHCSALDKKANATNWFTALATAKNLFEQLTATNIPPNSVLTSSESAMLRKVVQIGALLASCCIVFVVVSVFKSICFQKYPFSKVSDFGVHTAFCVFESLRFQSAFSKVSVFAAEQCECKVKTDTFISVLICIRSNVNGVTQ